MGERFDLAQILRDQGPQRYELHRQHLNPQLPRMLHAIGFDKIYTRAEGAYLYDADGHDYLDMLAGFGVFALGRHQPEVRQAMHDVVDAGLADLTQFDAPPLAGPLAEPPARARPASGSCLLRQQRHRGGRGGDEVRPLRHPAQSASSIAPTRSTA